MCCFKGMGESCESGFCSKWENTTSDWGLQVVRVEKRMVLIMIIVITTSCHQVGGCIFLCHWAVCPNPAVLGLESRVACLMPPGPNLLLYLIVTPCALGFFCHISPSWVLKSETDTKTTVTQKLFDRASDLPGLSESTSKLTHVYGGSPLFLTWEQDRHS